MSRLQMQKQWNRFVTAFNALGSETYGMTPAAASVLAQACAEAMKNPNDGYRSFQTGTPLVASSTVDIQIDFAGCLSFWEFDFNNLRAKITDAGCDYVVTHMNVFSFLNGLI